jgi:predicted DNA-binding protein (UPF0278 family)
MTNARDRAVRQSQQKAYLSQNFIEVGGEFVAVMKRKPTKLQKLESTLERLQDNYRACVRNGWTEKAADFEAAIKVCEKKIAKAA